MKNYIHFPNGLQPLLKTDMVEVVDRKTHPIYLLSGIKENTLVISSSFLKLPKIILSKKDEMILETSSWRYLYVYHPIKDGIITVNCPIVINHSKKIGIILENNNEFENKPLFNV